MKNTQYKSSLYRPAIAIGALLAGTSAAQAAFVISDPWGTGSIPSVNGNSEAISSSTGNVSLTSYNLISTKRVFNFDNFTSTGNVSSTQAAGGTLTATADALTATFGASGSGTFAFIAADAKFATSTTTLGREQAINTNRTTNAVSFNGTGVDAIAFTINRLQVNANLTLTFVDGATKLYAIPLNSSGVNDRNGFFGFSRLNESPATAKIRSFSLVTGSSSQFGIDDFAFVATVPEPTSTVALGLTAMLGLRRRRRAR